MKRLVNLLSLVQFLFIGAIQAYGRAGGGGGNGGLEGEGGFYISVFLTPFLVIYGAIITYKLYRKSKKSKELLRLLAENDPIWHHRRMLARVEEVFFKVQIAWKDRNQKTAKDCMSSRIYTKHKMQTDEMLKNHRKNILQKINLKEVKIISVSDYKTNENDAFAVFIKASLIDYHIDDRSGKLLSGSKSKVEHFQEIWHFIRERNKWLLDEIDHNITMRKIGQSEHFVEE